MNNSQFRVLLVSCYELGHQPAGIYMPEAFLRRAGLEVDSMDLSVEPFSEEKVRAASFIAISVPMHTALRLGVEAALRIHRINPDCHICFYGLYASLNADYLLEEVAGSIIGGEVEQALADQAIALRNGETRPVAGVTTGETRSLPVLSRLSFPVPDRSALPGLEHYAKLDFRGELLPAGYVEASRGCLHSCSHCPIPPVYGGRFFIVPADVVMEDIRHLVAMGARHITFGDPDFLNGPGHSMRIVRALHSEFPQVTFDFTAKIEHILKYRKLFPELAGGGCLFVVSAVESLSDLVLDRLDKGHTRDGVIEAVHITREARISLRPSFVAFTPWTTLDDYNEMLDFVEEHGLIENVDPVQYSIRLLVPPGSLLESSPDAAIWLGGLDRGRFTRLWKHPDPRMDELHKKVSRLVEEAASHAVDYQTTFRRVRNLSEGKLKQSPQKPLSEPILRPPRLTENWFC